MDINFNAPVGNVIQVSGDNNEIFLDNSKKVVQTMQSQQPATQHPIKAEVVEDIVPVTTDQPTAPTATQSQTINFELLEEYLNLRFYDNNPNYHKVVDMLSSQEYSDRDKAYFALKIYDTPNIIKPIKRPGTFSEWYAILAGIFHFPYHNDYSPNKLSTPSKKAQEIDQYIKIPILKR